MKIGYVTMIKDEDDVIYSHLTYYKNLGIRNFYIVDNKSTDNTLLLLFKFRVDNPDCKVHIEEDEEIGYWQYKRINRLAEIAYRDGCEWIIAVDPDELLFHNVSFTDFNLNELLNQHKDSGDYFKLKWWYYRPYTVYNNIENPFLEICLRDFPQQSALSKVIVKWRPGMEICQGNHQLHNESNYKEIDNLSYKLSYAHFNSRSVSHMKKKVVNLGIAYEAIKDKFYHEESLRRYNQYKISGDSYLVECIVDYINYSREKEYKPFPEKMFQ